MNAENSKSIDAMRKLIIPEALACANKGVSDKDAKAFLDYWLGTRMQYPIASNYQAAFSPIGGELHNSRLFTVPAQPTELMVIQSSFKPGKEHLRPEPVRQEGGKYYLVAPCPTADGVERLKATIKKQ